MNNDEHATTWDSPFSPEGERREKEGKWVWDSGTQSWVWNAPPTLAPKKDVFSSLKEKGPPVEPKWLTFYAERMKDPGRYQRHLLSHYAPFFATAWQMTDTMAARYARSAASFRSFTFVELGAEPGFIKQAMKAAWRKELDREQKSYNITMGRGYGSGLPLIPDISPWNAPHPLAVDLNERPHVDNVAKHLQYEQGTLGRCGILTFSLLEHLTDDGIMHVHQWIGGRVGCSLHYVSLEGHITPSFGDERLLSKQFWLDILKPFYWEVFNEGKDLVMVCNGTYNFDLTYTKRNNWQVEEEGEHGNTSND
jgi:hypothetical protein